METQPGRVAVEKPDWIVGDRSEFCKWRERDLFWHCFESPRSVKRTRKANPTQPPPTQHKPCANNSIVGVNPQTLILRFYGNNSFSSIDQSPFHFHFAQFHSSLFFFLIWFNQTECCWCQHALASSSSSSIFRFVILVILLGPNYWVWRHGFGTERQGILDFSV